MKKSRMITIIAVIALVAITAATLVAGTFARYATTNTATADAMTASWTFNGKLTDKDGVDVQDNTIDLVDTLTGSYPNLADGAIAPGTSGSFKIVVNGTGCGTGIDYSINITSTADSENGVIAAPAGMTFTVGEGATAQSMGAGITKSGTIALANVGTPVVIPVTWNWALGEDAAEANGVDNGNAGKDVKLNISIRGEQHIGDIPGQQNS